MFNRLRHALRFHADRFARFTAGVIYDQVSLDSPWTRLFAGTLKAFSHVFALIVRTRFFLYRHGVLRDTPLGCKVVVVGNITVGGTGKTPVTELFARVLAERGRKVVILSRGYKSRSEPMLLRFKRWLFQDKKPDPRVVSDGKKIFLTSDIAGDEPYMLAHNLLPLGVAVIVNRNRVDAGSFALKHFHCDTILLDDGLQYLPLRGQINLLLVDKTNPFGNGCLLPRGILREPVANLNRATYILLTKSDGSPAPELLEKIRAANPDAPIIECAHRPQLLSSLDGLTKLPLAFLNGKLVATFSGIATPERFEAFVRQNGAQVIHNERFLDHHRFTEEELDNVLDEAAARDAEFVVTTEKDAVRIEQNRKHRLPIYFLRLEIEILSGASTFDAAVERICSTQQSPVDTARSFTQPVHHPALSAERARS